MSKIENLLSGLQKLTPRGPGRWIACCPAHDDRNPSMTIRLIEDGRILLHCFAECGINEILAALNLSIEALFPEHLPNDAYRPVRMPANPSDILACCATDSMFLAVCAIDMARGDTITENDKSSILDAARRLQDAANYGR